MSDTRETALAKLDALVEGLADQQAMPDDSHRSRYQAIRAALAASPAPTLAPDDVLTLVQREIEKHLYTNTKNGNRQAMLNIVERVRAAMRARETAPEEGT